MTEICKCGSINHYDEKIANYVNTSGKIVGGSWCHWCDSGFLCGETPDCKVVYPQYDENGRKHPLPMSCCMNCVIST